MCLAPSHPGRRQAFNVLVTLALVALCLRAGVAAQPSRKVIRKISFEGLERESEADLLKRLKIAIGDEYDPAKVGEQTGALYRTNKFEKVEAPRIQELEGGVWVTFVVTERPLVRRVDFIGESELSADYLSTSAPKLRTQAGQLFNEAYARQDRDIIVEKYREDGYIFAHVRYEIEKTKEGVVVVFTISEGSRVRIREIRFAGNRSISSSTLLPLMETREKDFWFFGLVRKGFYDPEILEDDLRKIEDYYRRYGHFDARAQLTEASFDSCSEWLTLTIGIREGPVYTFQGYQLRGNAVFTDSTLLGLTSAQAGQPFNRDVLEADTKAVKDYYANRAYIFTSIEPQFEFSLKENAVKVRLEIRESSQIVIEEVKIRGNFKTKESVVRRELEFYPGERVDGAKIEESRSNLNRLQYLGNVSFSYEEASAPEKRNVVVKVEEQRFGNFYLSFGVSSGLGLIGAVRLRKNNFDFTDLPDAPSDIEDLIEIPSSFAGAGQTLVIEAAPGTEYSRYALFFKEPYLFGTRNALSLSLARREYQYNDYDETRGSLIPQLSHAFSFDKDFVFSLGSRLEEVEISDLDFDAPQAAREAEGYNSVIALNTGVSYDKLLIEYLEGPYSGSNTALFYEYAGGVLGGDVSFHKGIATNEFYFPLYTYKIGPETLHHVISFSNGFGVIEPQDSGDSVPIFERFFLGGLRVGEEVRGFDYRGLGPHEGNDPVGGTAKFTGSVEYSFPIFRKILRGVIFLDYANLSPTLDTYHWSEMRFAVGGGFRINFPFLGSPFPLAFYLGYPIKKEPEDEDRLFLFSLGVPF